MLTRLCVIALLCPVAAPPLHQSADCLLLTCLTLVLLPCCSHSPVSEYIQGLHRTSLLLGTTASLICSPARLTCLPARLLAHLPTCTPNLPNGTPDMPTRTPDFPDLPTHCHPCRPQEARPACIRVGRCGGDATRGLQVGCHTRSRRGRRVPLGCHAWSRSGGDASVGFDACCGGGWAGADAQEEPLGGGHAWQGG